ncbi:ABC transporter substrate-binding protein [Bacillaceae bacterium]
MNIRNQWWFLIPLIALGILTAGCVADKSADATQNDPKKLTKVRFALLSPGVTNVHVELAVKKGIFAKNGIDLEIKNFLTGGPEALAAVAGGDVDMGIFGSPVIVGISKGIPIKDVAAPVAKEVDFQLVATNDVKTIQDLKGKTIVTGAAGSGPHVAIRKILSANNIKESEVKIVNNGGADMRMVLESGQVSAVVTSEPIVSQIVLEGKGHVLAKAADVYGEYQHSHFFATTKLIRENPVVVRNVIKSYSEAVKYVKEHPDELIDYATEKLDLDRNLLKSYYNKNLPVWDEKLRVDVEGLLGAVKLLKETGDIDPDFNPSIEDLYDSSFELK